MALINVHQSIVSHENSYIFATNIAIPTISFQTANLTQRIQDFVNFEYSDEIEVYFEITARYTLVNTKDGTIRKCNSPEQHVVLSPVAVFRDAFSQAFAPLLDNRHLSRQFLHLIPNAHWALEEVESLIVNITAVVPSNYHRLADKGLVNQEGRRVKNKTENFVLP